MRAEIFCIGTELLIGDIVNTNASYISKRLSENGFDVLYHSVCGDNGERIEESLKHAFERSELVVTTGGLGPTYDDISVEKCAKVLGVKCEMNEEAVKSIEGYFERSGRKMTDNNLKQAFLPVGAKIFMNGYGTAPGICVEKDGKILVMLPGPPREMKPMLENQVIPYLKKYSSRLLVSTNVNIFGMGESSVEAALKDIMTRSKNPTLAPYVNDGEVRVRITASGENEAEAKKLTLEYAEHVKNVLGNCVYDIDSPSMEGTVVELLKREKLTVATAESCTGGLLSGALTNVSGSSSVFGFGVCTYANEAKMKLLNVKKETLDVYGAVSEQTAIEMAVGVRELAKSDIAVSLTGIAGPDGGSDEKPVGLVYLGVSSKRGSYAKKLLLAQHKNSDRAYVRTLAVKNALKAIMDEATEIKNDRA